MKPLTLEQCAALVRTMCDNHFMNGWLGDVSEEYQAQQADYLFRFSPQEQERWLERNRFNLVVYCDVKIEDYGVPPGEWNKAYFGPLA